jgi:hypothetical protein
LINTSGNNSFRDQLNARLKAILSKAKIERVAFFAQDPDGDFSWTFASYNVLPNGGIQPLPVAGMSADVQTLSNTSGFEFVSSDSMRMTPGSDQLFDFLENSQSYKKQGDLPGLISRVQRIENPDVNHPGTIDCVSCHTARPVRSNLIGSKILSESDWLKDSYASKLFSQTTVLAPALSKSESAFDDKILRSFGYYNNVPVISQRVVNESAKVAESFQ